ncbi:MAG: HAD family hydrolase [Spirochaetes bacterium]|nr:HAD family hydrolase [Spirochaetota bacterium]
MIEAVFIDLDDTILREKESAARAFAAAAAIAEARFGIEPEAFARRVRETARTLWYLLPTIHYCLRIGISSWEGLWAEFDGPGPDLRMLRDLKHRYRSDTWQGALASFGIEDAATALELSDIFCRERRGMHQLLPGAEGLLRDLQGRYRLGLITNGAPDLQWTKIRGSGVEDYFDSITISGDAGAAKPAALIFRAAMEGMRAPADRSVMIGDTLATDIAGAAGVGMKGIWVNAAGTAAEGTIMPDRTVALLGEIPPLLQEL